MAEIVKTVTERAYVSVENERQKLKIKLFEYTPFIQEGKGLEESMRESRDDFEKTINTFCTGVDVKFVMVVRNDVIGVWYEGNSDHGMPVE